MNLYIIKSTIVHRVNYEDSVTIEEVKERVGQVQEE